MKFQQWPKRDPDKNYFKVPNEVFHIGISYPEISIYCDLLSIEDRETYQCYPSYKTIGKALGMSENTVSKYVRSLEEKGLIRTEPTMVRSKDGRPLNGNLLYTIRPIQAAIELFYERQFQQLEEDTARRIAATQDAGFAGYEVSNIAHLRLCHGLPMTGGFGLNVTNQMAAQFYADHGLNSVLILPEVKDSDISTIAPTHNGKPVPTGVLVYGHMPLMVTRACPLQNIHDCAHCNKAGELTDRKAKKFPVRCGMGVRTIYNPVPIYMGDKPGALTVDYGVAYFTLESREEAAAILDNIRVHAPFEGEFTRGLYFKGTN